MPVHLNSPGLVVAPIPVSHGLSNQNTHYAYPDGSIHIMLLHHAQGASRTVYHHHWRTPDGVWKSEALPFSGNRPKLVGTEDRTLLLVYSRGDQLQITRGVPDAGRNAWNWSNLKLPEPHPCHGDALLDPGRWTSENTLSIYSQQPPDREIRTRQPAALDGQPSPLHVVDYRLDPERTR